MYAWEPLDPVPFRRLETLFPPYTRDRTRENHLTTYVLTLFAYGKHKKVAPLFFRASSETRLPAPVAQTNNTDIKSCPRATAQKQPTNVLDYTPPDALRNTKTTKHSSAHRNTRHITETGNTQNNLTKK